MKLKTLKTEAELFNAIGAPLGEGRKPVELITHDGKIKTVRIGTVHISFENYSLSVSYEQEYEKVDRYRVIATVQGMPEEVSYFDDYSEMSEKSLSYGTGVKVDTNGGKQIKVLIDSQGNVVEDTAPKTETNDDDIPF